MPSTDATNNFFLYGIATYLITRRKRFDFSLDKEPNQNRWQVPIVASQSYRLAITIIQAINLMDYGKRLAPFAIKDLALLYSYVEIHAGISGSKPKV